MIKIKSCLAVICLAVLAGCAKAPVDHQRYFLPAAGITSQSTDESATLLQISDVQLADFLDDGGLVLQLDDITLNQAKNHLWAEDLRQQISRGLRDRLNQHQQRFTVVGPQTAADLQLSLVIDAFHGRHDGQAVTSGQWQLENNKSEIVSLQRFNFTSELTEAGYPALVRALGKNLDELADNLAATLTDVP